MFQIIGEFRLEAPVFFNTGIFLLQFKQGRHECFRNIASAIRAKATLLIRNSTHHIPHVRLVWRDEWTPILSMSHTTHFSHVSGFTRHVSGAGGPFQHPVECCSIDGLMSERQPWPLE